MMLLYSKSTAKTGRKLAALLKIRAGKIPTSRVTIRWGSSFPANSGAINTRKAILLAAHGYNSLIALRDAGVSTPEVFLEPPSDPSIYPILGRNIYHRAGKDIIWCNNIEAATQINRPYFTKFHQVEKEFRIHVLGGNAIRVFRKVPRRECPDQCIRTSLRGWGYSRVNETSYGRGREVAIAATAALGLVFGGVDIGLDKDGEYIVFEVNTGPSLNNITLLYYARYLERYLLESEEGYVPSGICWSEEIERRISCGDSNE